MNPVPSFSEHPQSDYLKYYTLSVAATKSGDFGAASWFASGSSVRDEVDEISTVTETATETTGERSNESSGLPRGEYDETFAGRRHKEERREVRQDSPDRAKIEESREAESKDNNKSDEKIREQFDYQRPPRPRSNGKSAESDSSQVSKFKRFKKRVFHIFPREHKSKTDPHLLLMTSYSQTTESFSIEVSTMSDSITRNMSANSENIGASFPIQSTQSSVKESPEQQTEIEKEAVNENDHKEELSIQGKRARFQVFTRIAKPNSNPGRSLFEKKLVDKIEIVPSSDSPVDQIETVLSSDSDQKEIKIMDAEGNDIVMSQISPRIYVIKDDSNSVAVLSVQTADESEIAFWGFFCSPLNREANCYSFDDETSFESLFDGQTETSTSITVAIETIQKHAALLGISEHELLGRHCHDLSPTNEGRLEL
jgi:hypothetical protein